MHPHSRRSHLPKLVPFALCALALFSVRPATAQRPRCSADEPLHLSILFDNSGSVYHNLHLTEPELSNWFRSLAEALRPGDSFDVYTLATTSNRVTRRLGGMTVASGDREDDRSYRQDPDTIAIRLLADTAKKTDLAMSVKVLRGTLRERTGGTYLCGDVLVLVSDGSLDPYEGDRAPDGRDPASIAQEFINETKSIISAGGRVFAIGAGAANAKAFGAEYLERARHSGPQYLLTRVRTGQDLLVAAVGPSNYLDWDLTTTIPALASGDTASLFASVLAIRGDTALHDMLRRAGAGYVVVGFKGDSANNVAQCSHGKDIIANPVVTRVGRDCLYHIFNPDPAWRNRVLGRTDLNVLAYGTLSRFNFSSTPDSVYDPLQILVNFNPEGSKGGEPCSQALLLKAISRESWRADEVGERLAGRLLSGPGFSVETPITFSRIPGSYCYASVDALETRLPADSVFGVTLEHPSSGQIATTVLRHASTPMAGASFHSIQPLLSALFRRHEYLIEGIVRLADSSWAHAVRDLNVGGDKTALKPVGFGECGAITAASTEIAPQCLELSRGMVVETPPRAGYVLLSSAPSAGCEDSGTRCHLIVIGASKSVLSLAWLVLAFLVGVGIELFRWWRDQVRRRATVGWAMLLVVTLSTGLICAWLVDELAWKIHADPHFTLIHVLDLLRIVVEVCVAALGREFVRHAVKSLVELNLQPG